MSCDETIAGSITLAQSIKTKLSHIHHLVETGQASKRQRVFGNFRDFSFSYRLFQRPLQLRPCFDRGGSRGRKNWISTRPTGIYTHTQAFVMNIYAIYLDGTKPGAFRQTGSFPSTSGKEEISTVAIGRHGP
jgi:hypothetical protein